MSTEAGWSRAPAPRAAGHGDEVMVHGGKLERHRGEELEHGGKLVAGASPHASPAMATSDGPRRKLERHRGSPEDFGLLPLSTSCADAFLGALWGASPKEMAVMEHDASTRNIMTCDGGERQERHERWAARMESSSPCTSLAAPGLGRDGFKVCAAGSRFPTRAMQNESSVSRGHHHGWAPTGGVPTAAWQGGRWLCDGGFEDLWVKGHPPH